MNDLKRHHQNTLAQVEADRFSVNSSLAFQFLKNTTKYNCFDKREGAIVSKVLNKQGEIISDTKEVARLIIEHYSEIHKF